MLIGADSDEILGFTAFGFEGSELMAMVQTAMPGQLPYSRLHQGIVTHLTGAEGLTALPATMPMKSSQQSGFRPE